MESRRALVVGYGSIGKRHARLLHELGCTVSVLSAQRVDDFPKQSDLTSAVEMYRPDLIVIANQTSLHEKTLEQIAALDYVGTVLVEKPLFASPRPLPKNRFAGAWTGYNLRFHPVVTALRKELIGKNVVTAEFHVGQWLPDWRPQHSYRDSYSAKSSNGGGALRDLSHELDLAIWLLGPWRRLTALGGHYSSLNIDSDDCWSILIETENCPVVSIHLNYLDREVRRDIHLNTRSGNTIRADLVSGQLSIDGRISHFNADQDATYRDQFCAVLTANFENLCGLQEGAAIVDLAHAVELATAQKQWVDR